jgi:mannose-1-phosphate guanylyltransferase/mannose-6-phosphate isomerase
MLIPVILSGGSGTRLWPISRRNLPKQFLSLAGSETLFQQTVRRAAVLPDASAPIVVASDDHRFLAAEQLQELAIAGASILLEPLARNTAPAIAVGALQALSLDPEALILVLPADHLIGDDASFAEAVAKARPLASEGWLVTFGIRPDRAETGFGYIHRGKALGGAAFQVDQFVEKPLVDVAERYLSSGEYDWNSGMFLFRAARYLEELGEHAPAMLEAAKASFAKANADLDFIRLDADAFGSAPSDSIDYAVMEKTSRAAVVPVSCEWSDIGSWDALWMAATKDADGNHLEGDVIALDTKGTLVRSHDRHLVATIGLDDVVVVTTPDATLVARRDASQDVKRIVDQLKSAGRSEHDLHRVVRREATTPSSREIGSR